MLKIRAAALGAVLVLGMAGVAGAQGRGRQDGAGRGMRRAHGQLMNDLNLSDAQKTRIKGIHEKYRPQLETLMEQNRSQFKGMRDDRQKGDTGSAARAALKQQRDQFRQRVGAIRAQEHAEVRAVLTVEQRTKWDARSTERRARMEGRRQKMKGRDRQRRGV